MLKSQTPHIGIFGNRNIGKSSFINAVANQDISIVSAHAGTTTDPVNKRMEITGIGPCVLIDTAGVDDVGELGALRIAATKKVIKQVDLAILILTDNKLAQEDRDLMTEFDRLNTPFFIVHNKADLKQLDPNFSKTLPADVLDFSCSDKRNLNELVALIKKSLPDSVFNNPTVLGDLVKYGDTVVLVTPIDIEAPKGRIIMPQVQTIRDALDHECIIVMMKERELDIYMKKAKANNDLPALVITDSQVFLKVDGSVPKSIPMTSFSILFARLKGDFPLYAQGTPAIGKLKEGDNVLILESCSHHVTGDDIGRVKIPRWISNFTGVKLNFDVVAGLASLQRPITDYAIVVQCGGCMLTKTQVINRLKPAIDAGVPVTNYGMAIAYCHGIFDRAMAPFGKAAKESYL